MFLIYIKDGNPIMLFGFSIGSFLMAIILFLQRRKIRWTKVEISTITLFIICISIFVFGNAYYALIFGIISECIVGIYLIIETFKYPKVKYNLIGYFMFLIVSILSTINATDWSVEEMGYPLCEAILSIITIIPLLIKWKQEFKNP